MKLYSCSIPAPLLLLLLVPRLAHSQEALKDFSTKQAGAYPDSEGLQQLIQDILHAIKTKDSAKEGELIRSLLMPDNSTWFVDEFGPGFGSSLSVAYQRVRPELEQEIKTIYEGNVEREWITPIIHRFVDPESVNAPVDHFLNCMDEITPLYDTAFRGDSQDYYFSQKPGENKQVAGDLSGYFIYERGGFRFVPMEILAKLPKGRPVRIHLTMEVMQSKLVNEVRVRPPEEFIKRRLSGRVVVQLIVGLDGNVKELKALEGNPVLTAAVMDALKQWRFTSTKLDGDPVEVELEVYNEFH